MITLFFVIIFLAIALIPFTEVKWKGIIAVVAVLLIAIVSSPIAFKSLSGTNSNYLVAGSLVTGPIAVRIDALSGWFILIINFTFITGALYGLQYMKQYRDQTTQLTIHCISYVLVYGAMLAICSLQNSIAFLIAWEVMTIGCFFLIIFEHTKKRTLAAGLNFLVQSHICILFLTLGFIGVASRMNSYDFNSIRNFSLTCSPFASLVLFFVFFIGFAIKAGFVPFHTWLPYAHPAAPAHISGVLSGVIIKLGIYGILRMVLLIKSNELVIGYIVLFISLISGVYGVMLAIIQHNIKRLLAYHSIENIGIIGIGIGLGCIGMGKGNHLLTVLGFAGALLHTLNHSLFKSVLFYAAGNVYQSTHTMDIEQLGGLGKQMPHTSFLFLIASLAICGLPPFNGFVSEFLIYSGMFAGMNSADLNFLSILVTTLFALSLIGGLAILCFTKAMGTIFTGVPRSLYKVTGKEGPGKLIPMYAVILLILTIGIFPGPFMNALIQPVHLFVQGTIAGNQAAISPTTNTLALMGLGSLGFVAISGLVFYIRKRVSVSSTMGVTWVCGYPNPDSKLQYTASSFVRAYRKLVEPVLSIHKKKKEIKGVFPKNGGQVTYPYDKVEEWLIDYPLRQMKYFFNRFAFLQNGNMQFYILYGIVFIALVLVLPVVFETIQFLIHFLNQL
jgi:hydrogenase-4 component B